MGKPRHRPVRTELGYGVFSIHDPPTDGIDGTAGPPAESHPEPPVARTELQAPLGEITVFNRRGGQEIGKNIYRAHRFASMLVPLCMPHIVSGNGD